MRVLTFALCLAACAPDDLELAPPAALVLPPAIATVMEIKPSSTTAASGDPIGADNGTPSDQCNTNEYPDRGHWVYFPLPHTDDPTVSQKLLVFLAGHGETPESYPDFIQAAREKGYFVIALDYPNSIDQSLGQACDGTDGTCHWKHRYEITFGEEKGSSVSHISTCDEESIVNRLRRLLLYLRTNYSQWDKFTTWDDSEQKYLIDWSQIAVAGHAGFAAFLANHKDVYRVIMLAEPADTWNDPLQPAGWIATHATHASKYYGIVHHDDDFLGEPMKERVEMNWAALGLSGSVHVYNPSGTIPSGTHMIESDEPLAPGNPPHFDIARNGGTYAKAWKYMLGKGD